MNLLFLSEKVKLYSFYFASDPQTNNNRTFIVDVLTNTSKTDTIGFKGKALVNSKATYFSFVQLSLGLSTSLSTAAPEFGPYNTLMCRPGQIASFPLNTSISQSGLVVAMDFYPYSATSASSVQTIFSIRNTATNFISLICVYDRDLSVLNIKIDPASNPNYLFNPTSYNAISIQPGKY